MRATGASDGGEDDRLLHRLLFFTDAVFAIVLTLLVLELRPPEAKNAAELIHGLAEMINHFIAFMTSFALVSVFWLAHMNTMRRLSHFDWPTAIANLAFLLPVCLLPFASSLVGEARFGMVAWRFYCWTLIGASAAMMALTLVVHRGKGHLVGGVTPRERLYRVLRAASPGIAFAVSLVATEYQLRVLGLLSPLLIPVQFLIAERFVKPRPGPKPGDDPTPDAAAES
jgi:uncharacterized membrane protein